MSMSQDSQDFASLRRLLALKRHEQPPPGYFNDFSSQVIARIKAGDRGEEKALGRLFWEAPWLQRLWAALETKPILAGAFGTAVCALLIGGIVYSEKTEVQPLFTGIETTATEPMRIANAEASDQPILIRPASISFPGHGATPDVIAAAASSPGIFDLVAKPRVEAATFTTLRLSGGN
jgi:hypothetical protein